MPIARRVLLIAGILAACLVVDQATKLVADSYLAGTGQHSFLADTFRLTYARNPGAFLSLGAQLPESVRFYGFVVFVAISLVVMLLFALFDRHLTSGHVTALALVVGGGLSNLIDRILYDGLVIDFLNVGIGRLRTGIFNIADMAIMGGGILFIAIHLAHRRQARKAA